MAGRQDLFQQAMNQGYSAAWDQNWALAVECYRKALDEIPDNPQALINLGLAYFELQDFEQSLSSYLKAARLQPEDSIPLEKAAQIYERLGNLEGASQASLRAAELYLKRHEVNKAIENWQRVTRLDPENLLAHTRLAVVYEKLNNKENAVKEYLAIASLMQSSGQLEKAGKAVQQALQILPNNQAALQAFSLLRNRKPLPKPVRPHGATAPLRMSQVRQLTAPSTPEKPESSSDPVAEACQKALTALASRLFESADEDTAVLAGPRQGLQALVQGAAAPARPVDRSRMLLHLSQVVDLQTQERWAQAADELSRAIEAGLDGSSAYFDLGFLFDQAGETEKAITHLRQSLKSSEFALAAHLLIASIQQKAGQAHEASLEYLEALKIADTQVVDPEIAGDLRQLYDPLIEAHRQETDPQAHERLGATIRDLLMRPNWRTNLQKARQQLPAAEPGSPPVPLAEMLTAARSSHVVESLSKVNDLSRKGLLRSAMEEAFYAIQHAPTYLPLHTSIAELLVKEERLDEAAQKYETIARTYSVRGEPNRAIDLYKRIVELTPMDMALRTRLIDQLVACERTAEAVQQYTNMAEVYYSLADLEMARKTYSEALRLAQQVKIDRSQRVQIFHRMADIHQQSLDWRQALRIYEQICTLQPDDEKARFNVIQLNFRLGLENAAVEEMDKLIAHYASARQPARAVSFLEGLLNDNPSLLPIRRRLAEGYRQVGRIAEAIEAFDTLGDSLLEAGDRAGSIQAIEAIVAMDPPNKADYLLALDQLRKG